MSPLDFHCEEPDFLVASVPDGLRFPVRRDALQTSQVFCDMFSCCDSNTPVTNDKGEQILELYETGTDLKILLTLLHTPPQPAVYVKSSNTKDTFQDYCFKRSYTVSVIPFPLLPSMLTLADKYALPMSTVESLGTHLEAHAQEEALRVYGLATSHNLDDVASYASQFIRPLASYESNQLKDIPTVEAYQKILKLQAFRTDALKRLVLSEEIFPHGYRKCPSHGQTTTDLWERTAKNLAWRIDTLTDVAGEMEKVIKGTVNQCPGCLKAAIAAIEMLRYKCRRVPRKISQLNECS